MIFTLNNSSHLKTTGAPKRETKVVSPALVKQTLRKLAQKPPKTDPKWMLVIGMGD